VELIEGRVKVDAQLEAFEEAMKVIADSRGRISKIGIAFDHIGLFREQFVDPTLGLKNRRLKYLKLSDLKPEIREAYENTATKYGVTLKEISVISEDICRAKVVNKLGMNIDRDVFVERNIQCNGESCNLPETTEKSDFKVNCRGITAAIIDSLAKDADEIKTFWVYDSVRVKPATITQGTELSRKIFEVNVPVEQNIIWPNGKIHTTKI
jgi:hypothetical protein